MKVCSKCKIEKELVEFDKRKDSKDGLRGRCKSCRRKYVKAYRGTNKEILREKKKDYDKAYNETNKEKLIKRGKAYRDANKEKLKTYHKAYNEANKERKKAYRDANKERINEYHRERRENDPFYRIKKNIRNSIQKYIKRGGYKKTTKTQEILGCDFATLEQHLNDNLYGFTIDDEGLDVDHIIPLATAQTEEQLLSLNHYTNLQLLPSAYNQHIKRDKAWDREHFENWLKSI